MNDLGMLGGISMDAASIQSNRILSTYNSGENTEKAFGLLLEKAQETASGMEPGSETSKKFKGIDKEDKLFEQCKELETFILKTLLDGMRKTVMKSGLVDEGYAGKMYEDMLYEEYAKTMAQNASLGLAEQAYLELSGQRGSVINVKI